jgi:hypothetical protein
VDIKFCPECKLIKSTTEFIKRKDKKNSYRGKCKLCYAKSKKDYYTKNRKRILENKKEYQINNKLILAERKNKHYTKNKESISIKKSIWNKNNREIINKRNRTKRKNNIQFRISDNLRRKFNKSFKEKREYRFKDLVGCSTEDLKLYLESKFLSGMNWKNYGLYGWHIDHIIPVSKFNLSELSDIKKCFHFTNLQPLWAKDNLQKGSKLK